ncbi:NAD-dependent epimerase/dehydratase family protein [Nonomuraea fuscirosea]|uniref:NAD-dependent epimerase/dehydratase family protein n=1 Tax=Nonomuraea fuscirosea TaxID=1291556 RepID=UPI00342E1458
MAYLLEDDIRELVSALGDNVHLFTGRRVLITGANGFLGRYLVAFFRHLNTTTLAGPCRVTALDNCLTSGKRPDEMQDDPYITFVEHDVSEPFELSGGVDYIVHAAGIASPHYYRKFPLETMDVSSRGLRTMLELAQVHGAKLLFMSSSEIYGDPDARHVPTGEDYNGNVSCLGPRSCYDESKRFGETLLRVFHENYGVEAVIVRPFNIYGPGLQRTDYRVMPNIAECLVAGRVVNIYGTGRQTRTFCYVTDAIRGVLLALLHGRSGEAYNVGSATPEISMVDLVAAVREQIPMSGLRYQIVDYPHSYPASEPMRRCPDLTKAYQHLGYEPYVEFTDGLRRFFGWAQDTYR